MYSILCNWHYCTKLACCIVIIYWKETNTVRYPFKGTVSLQQSMIIYNDIEYVYVYYTVPRLHTAYILQSGEYT